MINFYKFGSIEINGKEYTKDLIFTKDEILVYPWWRKEGHVFSLSDIESILNKVENVTHIICGTGAYGMVRVEDNLIKYFKDAKKEVLVYNTKKAADKFNELISNNHSPIALFHLTC
ncbi:protein of unknown function DUF498 [Thermodesulfobium narugense DSM 14796]|uniref:Uncharacterized protein n=1 Tax=Thermodesulfobium narugense DSM 14796 TaxID=747365 RepID=M1E880_9BACT|nr:MTH938/NDUFAF3 family protein [Thermodesulfobium narugense]AEE15018.1 protein of unknown function DUF498 [Thermodesulfobium narugense DSM 14796]